jgi:hypothetical protein
MSTGVTPTEQEKRLVAAMREVYHIECVMCQHDTVACADTPNEAASKFIRCRWSVDEFGQTFCESCARDRYRE